MSIPLKARFLKEYRGRQPGQIIVVEDWGYGVCRALEARKILKFVGGSKVVETPPPVKEGEAVSTLASA